MAPAARSAASQASTLPATRAGMRHDCCADSCRAAALEHDDRLPKPARSAHDCDELLRLLDLLREQDDGRDIFVVEDRIQVICGRRHGLVSGGDEIAQTKPAGGIQEGYSDRAALDDRSDLASFYVVGKRRPKQGGGSAEIQEAEAVRAANREIVLFRERREITLGACTLLAGLAESAG